MHSHCILGCECFHNKNRCMGLFLAREQKVRTGGVPNIKNMFQIRKTSSSLDLFYEGPSNGIFQHISQGKPEETNYAVCLRLFHTTATETLSAECQMLTLSCGQVISEVTLRRMLMKLGDRDISEP